MVQIARTKVKRKRLLGKESQFRVKKQPVDNRKIDQYMKRKDITEDELFCMASPVDSKSLFELISFTCVFRTRSNANFSSISRFQCLNSTSSHSSTCRLQNRLRRLDNSSFPISWGAFGVVINSIYIHNARKCSIPPRRTIYNDSHDGKRHSRHRSRPHGQTRHVGSPSLPWSCTTGVSV